MSEPKKIFRKTDYSVFEAAAKALGLTPSALAVELGYGDNSWTKWRNDNVMPYVAGLACQALAGKITTTGSLFVVKTASPEQSTTLQTIFTALGTPFLTLDTL